MGIKSSVALLAAGTLLTFASSASADILFFSSQANTVEEADAVRNTVVNSFSDKVDFVAVQSGPWASRVEVEGKADQKDSRIGLAMGLHGELSGLYTYLDQVDDVVASDSLAGVRAGSPALLDLAKMGGNNYLYVPVMQASYIFAANVKAFEHLPEGLTREAVEKGDYTYADLLAWGEKMKGDTGANKLGFPAGAQGLLHRFFQGYLYPAFTGGVVRTYKNADAVAMWDYFKTLWQYVDSRSEAASHMQEMLLLADGPWVVFDHTSRLKEALDKDPVNIVALPAPSGPKGKAFMSVLAGVSIPKNTPDRAKSVELIQFLSKPETQINMLRATGFYPVVAVDLPKDLPSSSTASAGAIAKQSGAADALPALLPAGLKDKSGLFSKVYSDTFQQVVLRGADVKKTLDRQAGALTRIMTDTAAPCWAPDAASEGPCPVE